MLATKSITRKGVPDRLNQDAQLIHVHLILQNCDTIQIVSLQFGKEKIELQWILRQYNQIQESRFDSVNIFLQ